jgi:hypothetical protein
LHKLKQLVTQLKAAKTALSSEKLGLTEQILCFRKQLALLPRRYHPKLTAQYIEQSIRNTGDRERQFSADSVHQPYARLE